MTHQRFERKTYGRIVVPNERHIPEVERIIWEVDAFEAEYMPDKLVAVLHPNLPMVYLHKFEIDKIALGLALLKEGIPALLIDGQEEFSILCL